MVRLTDGQKKEIVSILKSALGNKDRDREAFLSLHLSASSVLERIDYSGSSSVFIPSLIETLLNYGEIERGKEALWAVLEAAADNLGLDYGERIEALRPAFEKSAARNAPIIETGLTKQEGDGGGDLRLNGEAPVRASTQRDTTERRPSPAEAGREYVASMRPIPPDRIEFYMAPCMVSNELYYHFVCANPEWCRGHSEADGNYLKHWVAGQPRAEDMRLPVTNVSFRAARAFAEWLSKLSSHKVRVPKLEEWQLASRAGQTKWFEEAIAAKRVNYFGTARHLHAVDAFGPNPYGIRDLIGQAFDMCFKGDDSSRPTIVGGCYHSTKAQLQASSRGEEVESDKVCPPDSSFRCVRDN